MFSIDRRNTCRLIGLIGLLVAAGCVTRPSNNGNSYFETFTSTYITEDQQKIAVLGARYHYVFEATPNLIRLINSDLHAQLWADYSTFIVETDNVVSGYVTLYLNAKGKGHTSDEWARATEFGMTRAANNGNPAIAFALRGNRYVASKATTDSAPETQLNKRYSVSVIERPSPGEASPSPITKAPNGILRLAAVPLAPFVMLYVIGSCNACR